MASTIHMTHWTGTYRTQGRSSLSLTTGARAGKIRHELDNWDSLCIGIGHKFRLFTVKVLRPEEVLREYLEGVKDNWTGMNNRFTSITGPVTPWGNIALNVTYSPRTQYYTFVATVGGTTITDKLSQEEFLDDAT